MLVLTGQFMQGLSKPNHAKLRRLTLPSSFIRWTCDFCSTGQTSTKGPRHPDRTPHHHSPPESPAITARRHHPETEPPRAVASTHKEAKEPTLTQDKPPPTPPHQDSDRGPYTCVPSFKPNLAHKYAMQDPYMCSQIKPCPLGP